MIKSLIILIGNHLENHENQESLERIGAGCKNFAELMISIQKYLVVNQLSLPQRLDLRELDVYDETRQFIKLIQDTEEPPKSKVLIKHRPNQGSQNLIKFSRKETNGEDDRGVKYKRLSLMHI